MTTLFSKRFCKRSRVNHPLLPTWKIKKKKKKRWKRKMWKDMGLSIY